MSLGVVATRVIASPASGYMSVAVKDTDQSVVGDGLGLGEEAFTQLTET